MFWKKTEDRSIPLEMAYINNGNFFYQRENGAVSCCNVDHLQSAHLRTIHGRVYWHLVDEHGHFVLLPESTSGVGELRRYLSAWRGFNYDGLCRFDSTKDERLLLWPLLEATAA